MKYQFIAAQRRCHRVTRLCAVLGVTRSGYYAWRRRPASRRAQEDQRLLAEIRGIHTAHRENYGAEKTWHELRERGEACGRHRVARLRREAGIEAKRMRRFRRQRAYTKTLPPAPNRLQQRFVASRPNVVWVADTTFIPTCRGAVHLAIVLDLYARRVVGWSMRSRNDLTLTLGALEMAITQRRPGPGLIHHSDQGGPYVAARYLSLLRQHGFHPSMSRTGNCYDNAVAESFFSNLKNEATCHQLFPNRDAARAAIFDYIEVFYNRQRRHQTLGYQSPAQFEQMTGVA